MAHSNIPDMEEFENKGWQQMSIILDNEMPVKQSKKRILPWWIYSTAAAIICIIGIKLFNNNSSVNIGDRVSDTTSTTITKVLKPSDNSTSVDNNIASQITPKNQLIENPNPETTNINTSTSTTLPHQTTTPKTNKLKNKNLNNYNHPTIPNDNSDIYAIQTAQQTSQLTDPLSTNANPSAGQPNPTNTEEYTKIIFIVSPLLNSGTTVAISPQKHHIRIPSVHSTPINKFKKGIQVFSAYSFSKRYSEIGAGIFGDLNLNNRWSIVSSINLARRNQLFDTKQNEELLLDTDPLADPLADPTGMISGQNNSISTANDIKLHLLTIQLGLAYQLDSKWGINTSIIPSYTIIDDEAYQNWYTASLTPNTAADRASAETKAWNTNGDIGLTYTLNEHLSMGLNYSYLIGTKGENNYLNPNFESNEWRLSVQYILD